MYYYDNDYYDESDSSGAATPVTCSDMLLFPVYLVLGMLLMFLIPVLPLLLLIGYVLITICSSTKTKIKNAKRSHLALVLAGIMVVEALACVFLYRQILPLMPPKPQPISTVVPRRGAALLVTTAPSRPPRPSSTSTPVPTSTPAALLQTPLTPFAAYAPPSSETPVAVERDTRLAACEGKPLYLWKSPSGTGDESGKSAPGSEPSAVSVLECPDMAGGWMYGTQGFGAQLPEPPIPGVGARRSCGGRDTLISVIGFEELTTALGAFPALRIDAHQGYNVYGVWTERRGWIKHIEDSYHVSEWWVCGYGLTHVSTTHRYDNGVTPRSESRSEVALLTAMSTAYHESVVRVILADMQLAGIVDAYRARIPDAAVREAVRRWDAGVRVTNIDGFQRKTIAGQ